MFRATSWIGRSCIACTALTVACGGDPTAPRNAASAPQPPRRAAVLPKDITTSPTDDELARIAASVPAFGGMHFDHAGRLVVSLTDTGQRAAVVAAIRPILGERRAAKALADFTVRPARFGFTQLQQWRKRANPAVLGMTGVVFTDVDEESNHVLIAVDRAPIRVEVMAALTRLGLPADAVQVVEHAPIRQLQTVQDYRRPPLAGMQIAYSGALCTSGPALEVNWTPWDGVSYFITAAHCTDIQGAADGTQYYQPLVGGGNHVAVEERDPAFFSGGACPPGRRCRYSDAALIRYDSPWPDALGSIAQTTSFGQYSGSLTLGGQDVASILWFNGNAQDWISPPFVGQQIEKVGRTTGWTRGGVTNTCVDINPGGTDITMLCQTLVNAGAGPGDSGAPVFESGGSSYATLYGVLWAGSGGTSFAFSPLKNVESELGVFYYCYC
jgi:hypothetical protein